MRLTFALVEFPLALLCAACAGTEQPIFEAVSADATHVGLTPVAEPAQSNSALAPGSDLDPNVNFAWSETLPGQGTCKPGIYGGVFSCALKNGNLVTQLLSAQGTVTFTLGAPNEERKLPISNGALGGPLFRGTLGGLLDCSSDALMAMSADGQAIQLDGLMGPSEAFVTFPSFTAALAGKLDRSTLVIQGAFVMVNDSGETCNGTFTASASP
jgi:hypothetical protein